MGSIIGNSGVQLSDNFKCSKKGSGCQMSTNKKTFAALCLIVGLEILLQI